MRGPRCLLRGSPGGHVALVPCSHRQTRVLGQCGQGHVGLALTDCLAPFPAVALNYQSEGRMLQLNRAKFSANGSCGYVLKPQCMCQGEAVGPKLGGGLRGACRGDPAKPPGWSLWEGPPIVQELRTPPQRAGAPGQTPLSEGWLGLLRSGLLPSQTVRFLRDPLNALVGFLALEP